MSEDDISDLVDSYGNATFPYGPTKHMDEFQAGDLVRYGTGSTALAQLSKRPAGGWHAKQCMGGYTFIGASFLHTATPQDMRIWKGRAKWRKDTP